MTQKAEGCTVYNGVTIVSDTVTLAKGKTTKCSMDKSEVNIIMMQDDIHPQISKAEIPLPLIGKKASRIPDYPPRIYIT